MSLLPPDGYVSTSVAAVYSIAEVARIECGSDPIQESTRFLRDKSAIYVRYTFDGPAHPISPKEVQVIRREQFEFVNFEERGVTVWFEFAEPNFRPGSEIYPDNQNRIARVEVDLYAPYTTCLSQLKRDSHKVAYDQNGRRIQCAEITAYLKEIFIVFPSIEYHVVSQLRQAIAAEQVPSYLLQDTGEFVRAPGHVWRTPHSEKLFAADQLMYFNGPDGKVVGYPFIKLQDIIDYWKIYYTVADAACPQSVRPDAVAMSPYMALMMRATRHFGLSAGKRQDGSRLIKDELENWLSANWPAELGKQTTAMIGSMATLIRHPDDARGGNVRVADIPASTRIQDQSSNREILAKSMR